MCRHAASDENIDLDRLSPGDQSHSSILFSDRPRRVQELSAVVVIDRRRHRPGREGPARAPVETGSVVRASVALDERDLIELAARSLAITISNR